MNIDIQNIGHYRLTSHGGRSFDLYNRNNGSIYTIKKDEYSFIMSCQNVGRCRTVESYYREKTGI